MASQDFIRDLANYKMMQFIEDRDDPIIERAGEIEDDREPLEGDDGEDERQAGGNEAGGLI